MLNIVLMTKEFHVGRHFKKLYATYKLDSMVPYNSPETKCMEILHSLQLHDVYFLTLLTAFEVSLSLHSVHQHTQSQN